MRLMILKSFVISLLLVLCAPSFAAEGDAAEEPMTLSDLVRSVRDTAAQAESRLQARQAEFVAARDEQRALLNDARRRRQAAEAEADALRAAFEVAEDELADLETKLDENAGDLREVFSVVRQVAGDAVPVLQNSLVGAQNPERNSLVERLASGDSTPTSADLRDLWLPLLDEMEQSGRVARFDAPVISAAGEETNRKVTRIGTFTALADGSYLRFLPESGKLLALARQPAGASAAEAVQFERAEIPLAPIAIDPSRGSILALIVQTPEMSERIAQGGIIGYLILIIGAVGLVLGATRFVKVMLTQRQVKAEVNDPNANHGHTIGRLREVSVDPAFHGDSSALAAKLDEVVAAAAEQLNRGLPTLAIFAAVSPLLGLLGTVTGMIETFQVITLFGAGDPRLMSGGISQALITTQLGLAVAIPLLLLHSFLQSRANALITTLDQTATDLFARELGAEGNSANVR